MHRVTKCSSLLFLKPPGSTPFYPLLCGGVSQLHSMSVPHLQQQFYNLGQLKALYCIVLVFVQYSISHCTWKHVWIFAHGNLWPLWCITFRLHRHTRKNTHTEQWLGVCVCLYPAVRAQRQQRSHKWMVCHGNELYSCQHCGVWEQQSSCLSVATSFSLLLGNGSMWACYLEQWMVSETGKQVCERDRSARRGDI